MDIKLVQTVVITVPGDETQNEPDNVFTIKGDWRLYLDAIEHIRAIIAETINLMAGDYGCVEFDFEIEADCKYEAAVAKQEARDRGVALKEPINQLWLNQLGFNFGGKDANP